MKSGLILGLILVPYGALIPGLAGNPNGDPYIGQAGSTYDAAANPAQTNGVVAYNPYAPLAKPAAAAATMGPSGSATGATSLPAK